MILVNTPDVPNMKIVEVHGLARGSTVRARNVGRDIFAGLKNLIGGEVSEYTKLQAESREEALKRLIDDGKKLGANAIINIRFNTSVITQGTSEMLAYGTAVTVKQNYVNFILYVLGLFVLIILIIIRVKEKKKEDFEKRDN